jgi:hypothetical protein
MLTDADPGSIHLPIFQILFMVVYLRMAPGVRGWFQHGESTGLASADG